MGQGGALRGDMGQAEAEGTGKASVITKAFWLPEEPLDGGRRGERNVKDTLVTIVERAPREKQFFLR